MLKPEFPHVFSSHMREANNTCHRLFYWSVIMGLRPKETSVHLTAGKAYAAALEAFRRTYFCGALDSIELYDKAVAAGLEALILSYGSEDPPEGEKKTFDRTVAAFIEYLFNYPPATEHAKPSQGSLGPRVEFSFAFEIPGVRHPETDEPLFYVGRIDNLVDYNSALFVMDDKTASGIGPHWRRQWDLRSQITGYVKGARDHDLPVIGAIIRGMAILKESCKTAEAITHRPQWMIDRWSERLVWDVKQMISMWKADYWPNTGEESGACYNYGICPYHVLCTAESPEKYAPVYFDDGRWDSVTREIKK